jgi:hypothetical protein
MITTIPRNHVKRIAALKQSLTRCTVYSLSNDFTGRAVDPAVAWAELARFYFAKLQDRGNGTYHVTLHSSCWYELAPGTTERETQS